MDMVYFWLGTPLFAPANAIVVDRQNCWNSMSLACDVEDLPQGCLMRIRGQADTAATAEIERFFLRVTAGRPRLVVLDLSGMSFVSSLAMGSLMNLHRAVTRQGGLLRLAAVQPLVAEAFARVRLPDVIEVWDSVESALAMPSRGPDE